MSQKTVYIRAKIIGTHPFTGQKRINLLANDMDGFHPFVDDKYLLTEEDLRELFGANVDRCVCCGAIVPEGRQVCPNCEEAVK